MTGAVNTPSSQPRAAAENDEPDSRPPQTAEPQGDRSLTQASPTAEEQAAIEGRTTRRREGDTLPADHPRQSSSGADRPQPDPARRVGTPGQASTTPPDHPQWFSTDAHSTTGLRLEADFTGNDEHPAVRAAPNYAAGFTGPDGGSTIAAIADAVRGESEESTLASELATGEERLREIQAIMDNAPHRLELDDRVTSEAIVCLYKRLLTMPVIEQAKGIIMATNHCAPDEAFDILRRASQRTNVKVRVLAQQIVARTVSRERAGRCESG